MLVSKTTLFWDMGITSGRAFGLRNKVVYHLFTLTFFVSRGGYFCYKYIDLKMISREKNKNKCLLVFKPMTFNLDNTSLPHTYLRVYIGWYLTVLSNLVLNILVTIWSQMKKKFQLESFKACQAI